MDMWKNRVVPRFKLLLAGGPKKVAADAFLKSFDESKEETNKEFEEKKGELKPKVIGIYEASSTELKALIKEPKVSNIKKHSAKVQQFLTDLADIDFPGSKAVSEAASKCGPALVHGPVQFIFEKVSTFIVTEEITTREIEIPPPAETTTEAPPATTTTTTTTTTEVEAKEVVVEKVVVAEPVKVEAPVETPAPTPAPAPAPAPVEATKETPAKVEAVKPEEPPKEAK